MSPLTLSPTVPASPAATAAGQRNEQTLALRWQAGFVYTSDLEAVFRVSRNTIALWMRRGLRPFRPATREYMFRLSDALAFLDQCETFSGVATKLKRRKAAG